MDEFSFDERPAADSSLTDKLAESAGHAISIRPAVRGVKVTFSWLKKKIKKKLSARNVEKVAVANLDELVGQCDNPETVAHLKELSDAGYTHLIATVDVSGEVNDAEVVRDTSRSPDEEVAQFINRTGEGMVVVTG